MEVESKPEAAAPTTTTPLTFDPDDGEEEAGAAPWGEEEDTMSCLMRLLNQLRQAQERLENKVDQGLGRLNAIMAS